MILSIQKSLKEEDIRLKKIRLIDLYSHGPFPSGSCLEKNDLPTSSGKTTSFEKTTSHWKKNFPQTPFIFIGKWCIYYESFKNDITGLKRLKWKREMTKGNTAYGLISPWPSPSTNCLEKNDLPTSSGKTTSFEKTTSHWKNFFFPKVPCLVYKSEI